MDRVKTELHNNCLDGWDKGFSPNKFLFKCGSFLSQYMENGFEAGNLINNWSARYNINQRLILITLQKEQGLLTKKTLAEAQEKYQRPDGIWVSHLEAACGCGMWDAKTLPNVTGFTKQIELACDTYRKWYNAFKPDTMCQLINEPAVIPETAITLAFLKYTPHLSVLKCYENYWKGYFDGWLGWEKDG